MKEQDVEDVDLEKQKKKRNNKYKYGSDYRKLVCGGKSKSATKEAEKYNREVICV